MNKVTEATFEVLRKDSVDSSLGGGLSTTGSFRPLWEPTEGNNNFKELGKLFDRSILIQEYVTEVAKPKFKYIKAMQAQVQSDTVAPIHRDLTLRYSSRIHRILEETQRRKAFSLPAVGLVGQMETKLSNCLAAQEEKTS